MVWQTDEVYRYLSGDSHINEIDYASEIQLALFLLYAILLCIPLLIFISGCAHALFNSVCKCCKREDNFQYFYMFVFMIYFWEYICDIFFIAILFITHYHSGYSLTDMHNKYTILLWITLGCVAVTSLLNITLCCRIIHTLYTHNQRISRWFGSCFHSLSFVLLSWCTFGPFISIPLFDSNLFGMSLFRLQINRYDINYIIGLKFLNIITQLIPLFFMRIVYLFWMKTFNILILSSLLPISLSLCISSCYLCCATTPDKYLLRGCFEVFAARLSSLRHIGLTKHLQHRFCALFHLKPGEVQIFQPVDCCDSKRSRFEICFIVNCDENTQQNVQDSFCSHAHNEAIAKQISETFGIGTVYIGKQSAEIIETVDVLWGAKKQKPAHKQKEKYDAVAAHPAYLDNVHTARIYHDGERNRNEIRAISEEDDADEAHQLIIRQRNNVADASSLTDINALPQTDDPQVEKAHDQFDVTSFKPRLSSQEMRLQNWERYSMKANHTKHKHVATPSFSISAMDSHQNDTASLGSIAAADKALHQTKSVMVDPVDVQHALSLQSKQKMHLLYQNDEFLDSEREDSQTQSLQNNAAHIEPQYDQILHKPRTARNWNHQNVEKKQMLLLQREAEESRSSTDSYDTHTATGTQTDDSDESRSKASRSDIVVPEATGAHYQYNKVITIDTKRHK